MIITIYELGMQYLNLEACGLCVTNTVLNCGKIKETLLFEDGLRPLQIACSGTSYNKLQIADTSI